MKLDGKIALITGAGSGLGQAVAEAYAREGAHVFSADLDEKSAAATADRCREIAGRAGSARCDVSDSGSVAAAFESCDEQLGALDILVNNAGIIHSDEDYLDYMRTTSRAQVAEIMAGEEVQSHMCTIEKLSDEMFDRMLRVHLYGTFYCTREALPRMREHGRGGRIVNMGSVMGTASLAGVPDYCAAKGAILAFTRATAREAASYGVLANAIAPGYIDTPLLDPLEDVDRQLITTQTPLHRLGQSAEVASVAVFLASEDSSFMTGQTVSPNGGIYMSQ